VLELGSELHACLELMSGAVWVRDRLAGAGWAVDVADARKVKNVAPLACKTDKVDVRALAELCRRELVPALRQQAEDPVLGRGPHCESPRSRNARRASG